MPPMRKRILNQRFELTRLIDSGGMGSVYEARDRRDGSTVAVKLLHRHLTRDATYAERFRREARIAATLESPNIVKALEVGDDDGDPYIVMEYIDGVSLRDLLTTQSKLDVPAALDLATQLASALKVAHEKGVIHRDIKPANILITREGIAKVTDFGVARMAGASQMTLTSDVVGTAHYLAPEGASGELTARSDIYSLGCVLYQALAGQPPFDGPTPWEIVRKHREAEVPPIPASLAPLEIVEIVQRCLEKDPLARYDNAAQLTQRLNEVTAQANHVDVQLDRLSLSSAAKRPSRLAGFNPRRLTLIALIATACLFAADAMEGGTSTLNTRPLGHRSPANPLVEQMQYSAVVTWDDEPALFVDWPDDLTRNPEEVVRFKEIPASPPTWSPFGNQLAICGIPTGLTVAPSEPGILVASSRGITLSGPIDLESWSTTPVGAEAPVVSCSNLLWSPAEHLLAFDEKTSDGSDVWATHRGLGAVNLTKDPGASNRIGSWLGDLTLLILRERDCAIDQLYLYDDVGDFDWLSTNGSLRVSKEEVVPPSDFAIGLPQAAPGDRPIDQRVAYLRSSHAVCGESDPQFDTVMLLDSPYDPEPTALLSASDLDIDDRSLRWAPSGQLLAFVATFHGRQALFVVEPDSGALTKIIDLEGYPVSSLDWSADGAAVALTTAGGDPVREVGLDGAERQPTQQSAYMHSWSPMVPAPYVDLHSLKPVEGQIEDVGYAFLDGDVYVAIAATVPDDNCYEGFARGSFAVFRHIGAGTPGTWEPIPIEGAATLFNFGVSGVDECVADLDLESAFVGPHSVLGLNVQGPGMRSIDNYVLFVPSAVEVRLVARKEHIEGGVRRRFRPDFIELTWSGYSRGESGCCPGSERALKVVPDPASGSFALSGEEVYPRCTSGGLGRTEEFERQQSFAVGCPTTDYDGSPGWQYTHYSYDGSTIFRWAETGEEDSFEARLLEGSQVTIERFHWDDSLGLIADEVIGR